MARHTHNTQTTDGHRDFKTESAQWVDSVIGFIFTWKIIYPKLKRDFPASDNSMASSVDISQNLKIELKASTKMFVVIEYLIKYSLLFFKKFPKLFLNYEHIIKGIHTIKKIYFLPKIMPIFIFLLSSLSVIISSCAHISPETRICK